MKSPPIRETVENIPEGSDLELMAYFDGELEEPRRSEVERLIAADADLEAKVSGLTLGAALARERYADVEPGGAMSDAIMDAIARQDDARQDDARQEEAHVQVDRQAETRREGRLQVVDGGHESSPASNDNGRLIFRLAAIAAAAAAVLFFWGRADLDGDPTKVAQTSQVTAVTAMVSPIPSGPANVAKRPDGASAKVEVEEEAPGVEVAAVDFGSRTGAIYYVSGANNGAATPVVWLSDD